MPVRHQLLAYIINWLCIQLTTHNCMLHDCRGRQIAIPTQTDLVKARAVRDVLDVAMSLRSTTRLYHKSIPALMCSRHSIVGFMVDAQLHEL